MKLKWNEKRSGIYLIKNKVNSKLYIGKSVNLHRRKYQHLCELKYNKHKNKYLQASVNKYGINNFEFQVIEFCEKDSLSLREYFWINHYKTYIRSIGYNIELLDENGNSIRSYESINQMRLTLKQNKGKYVRPKGKDNPTSKEVYQYDLDGNFIRSFGSCHEASEILGCKESFTTISKCARKESGSSFNYQWRYFKKEKIESHSITEKVKKLNKINFSKPIIAINLLTGEKLEFSSISEASIFFNLAISSIARIAKGERKKSKKLNMTFFFKKDLVV